MMNLNIPARVEKIPEKVDLKNDRELHSERLPQRQEMRDKKEIEGKPSAANFYRVIVTNNLFRPLGYRKPKQGPSFQ